MKDHSELSAKLEALLRNLRGGSWGDCHKSSFSNLIDNAETDFLEILDMKAKMQARAKGTSVKAEAAEIRAERERYSKDFLKSCNQMTQEEFSESMRRRREAIKAEHAARMREFDKQDPGGICGI